MQTALNLFLKDHYMSGLLNIEKVDFRNVAVALECAIYPFQRSRYCFSERKSKPKLWCLDLWQQL